ncbi:hypothetical protein D3C81_1931430 [compost metagenome]
MPVFVAGRAPDDVACTNLDDGLAFALCPAAAGGDDQGLSERVGVPGRACSGLEGDTGNGHSGRFRREVQGVDSHSSGEPLLRAFDRGLRTWAFELHDFSFRFDVGFEGCMQR